MQMMTVTPPRTTSLPFDDASRGWRRKLALLAAHDRFDYLTSDQAARLDGGSRQKVTRILQECVKDELLEMPGAKHLATITRFFDARPRVHALTRKGAQVLANAHIPVDLDKNRTSRNRRAILLQHTIETAELLFHFDAAAASHGLDLIDHNYRRDYLPLAAQAEPKPFCLHPRVSQSDFPHLANIIKDTKEIPVEPDRLITLVRDALGWTLALELDRSSENVVARRIKGKATIFRKQLAYYLAWRRGHHIEQFGEVAKAFRVLFVTTSERRALNMVAAQHAIGGVPAGLFLYTTLDRIVANGVLAPVWISSERDNVSIIERS